MHHTSLDSCMTGSDRLPVATIKMQHASSAWKTRSGRKRTPETMTTREANAVDRRLRHINRASFVNTAERETAIHT